ncbi:hypothetical protein GF336_05650 [Candidatus Woesearchaeota archaeon]|nr:hypothetical protein [Candidatus Woesearchaeota archaeon]
MIKGILVEGVDCSGKTTLVTRLKTDLSSYGWDSQTCCHRSEDQFDRYLQIYCNSDRIIFDRGHFSEIVYGDLWRKSRHFQQWEIEWLNEYVLMHFIVIWCYASEECLKKRYTQQGINRKIKVDQLIHIQTAFENLFQHNSVIKYCSDSFVSLDKLVDMIYYLIHQDNEGINEHDIIPPLAKEAYWGIIVHSNISYFEKLIVEEIKVHFPDISIKMLSNKITVDSFLKEYSSTKRTVFIGCLPHLASNARTLNSQDATLLLNDLIRHKFLWIIDETSKCSENYLKFYQELPLHNKISVSSDKPNSIKNVRNQIATRINSFI